MSSQTRNNQQTALVLFAADVKRFRVEIDDMLDDLAAAGVTEKLVDYSLDHIEYPLDQVKAERSVLIQERNRIKREHALVFPVVW